jgi:hypothetical protein
MTPEEVQGLQGLALAHGGSLTVNPETGLYEANILKKLLPVLAGGVLKSIFPNMSDFGTSLIVGGASALIEGDLQKGLKAGMGAYSGSRISNALQETGFKRLNPKPPSGDLGLGDIVPKEAEAGISAIPYTTGKQNLPYASQTVTQQPVVSPGTPPTPLPGAPTRRQVLGEGLKGLFSKEGFGDFRKALGGPYETAFAISPIISAIEEAEVEKQQRKIRSAQDDFPYYIPGAFDTLTRTFAPGSYFDAKGQPYKPKKPFGFAEGGVADREELKNYYESLLVPPDPMAGDPRRQEILTYIDALNASLMGTGAGGAGTGRSGSSYYQGQIGGDGVGGDSTGSPAMPPGGAAGVGAGPVSGGTGGGLPPPPPPYFPPPPPAPPPPPPSFNTYLEDEFGRPIDPTGYFQSDELYYPTQEDIINSVPWDFTAIPEPPDRKFYAGIPLEDLLDVPKPDIPETVPVEQEDAEEFFKRMEKALAETEEGSDEQKSIFERIKSAASDSRLRAFLPPKLQAAIWLYEQGKKFLVKPEEISKEEQEKIEEELAKEAPTVTPSGGGGFIPYYPPMYPMDFSDPYIPKGKVTVEEVPDVQGKAAGGQIKRYQAGGLADVYYNFGFANGGQVGSYYEAPPGYGIAYASPNYGRSAASYYQGPTNLGGSEGGPQSGAYVAAPEPMPAPAPAPIEQPPMYTPEPPVYAPEPPVYAPEPPMYESQPVQLPSMAPPDGVYEEPIYRTQPVPLPEDYIEPDYGFDMPEYETQPVPLPTDYAQPYYGFEMPSYETLPVPLPGDYMEPDYGFDMPEYETLPVPLPGDYAQPYYGFDMPEYETMPVPLPGYTESGQPYTDPYSFYRGMYNAPIEDYAAYLPPRYDYGFGPVTFQEGGEVFEMGPPGMSGAPQYAAGGKLLKGPGDGMSDDIPANIEGEQEARLADGEFVIPADVVSHLGNGSTEAGAKKLYAMMDKIRAVRTGRTKQAPEINPDKYLPV